MSDVVTPSPASRFADTVKAMSAPLTIQKGLSLARWQVAEKDVIYQREDVHTLSLYLQGGENSYRTDQPHTKGGPGKLCFMPKNACSQWAIRDDIDFVHLYIEQQALDWFFVSTFDADVREGTLPEWLYQRAPNIQSKLSQCLQLQQPSRDDSVDLLCLEQLITEILYLLFQTQQRSSTSNTLYTGGLSPYHRKQVKAFIHSQYMHKLSLEDMAKLSQLSVFHFAKMFKCSFGCSPAAYLNRVRIAKIKQLLLTNTSLADVSLATGFAHQSHMTQAFKRQLGTTPAQYRNYLMSR